MWYNNSARFLTAMSQAIVSDNTLDHRSMNNFLTRGWGGEQYDRDKNNLEGMYPHAKIFVLF